jgi:hypothetical protein
MPVHLYYIYKFHEHCISISQFYHSAFCYEVAALRTETCLLTIAITSHLQFYQSTPSALAYAMLLAYVYFFISLMYTMARMHLWRSIYIFSEGNSLIILLLVIFYRESTAADKVKEAHRRVMVANHPDAGGSHYLASKINEAKDILLGKTKGGGSAF